MITVASVVGLEIQEGRVATREDPSDDLEWIEITLHVARGNDYTFALSGDERRELATADSAAIEPIEDQRIQTMVTLNHISCALIFCEPTGTSSVFYLFTPEAFQLLLELLTTREDAFVLEGEEGEEEDDAGYYDPADQK